MLWNGPTKASFLKLVKLYLLGFPGLLGKSAYRKMSYLYR